MFIRLLKEDKGALELWDEVTAGPQEEALVSCITLYELQRSGLRGLTEGEKTDRFLDALPQVCSILWLRDAESMRRATRLAHGNGLAMADALILFSLIEAGAEVIYTTDSDFEAYKAGPRIVRL
ncbi:type II toxin-antitoxin system VapC family toxin [Truepera radiovictrix]|uniref:type II toxin-antitoxin system VapC family toxin n=1 Tax=Truepera radiovictrix TaxID=332249 RepID=UPI0002E48DF9|nr:PIN domain-containing protein [Truepera radiovictrix]WMT58553.1 PIN domain-containing protein [Truepera radiovictrix]